MFKNKQWFPSLFLKKRSDIITPQGPNPKKDYQNILVSMLHPQTTDSSSQRKTSLLAQHQILTAPPHTPHLPTILYKEMLSPAGVYRQDCIMAPSRYSSH